MHAQCTDVAGIEPQLPVRRRLICPNLTVNDIQYLTVITDGRLEAEIQLGALKRLEELTAEKFAADQRIAKEAADKKQDEAADKAAQENAKREAEEVRQVAALADKCPDLESLNEHIGDAEPTPAQQRLRDHYTKERDDKLRADQKIRDDK